MSLNQYIQKIDRLLSKDEKLPVVVDVQNEADQAELVQHYHVGENELIPASKYCASDEMPRYEELLNDLATENGVLIVTGVTSYLKLDGEQELQRFLRKVLNMTVAGNVVFITYQCKRYLPLYDQRIARRIVVVDNTEKKYNSVYSLKNIEAYTLQGTWIIEDAMHVCGREYMGNLFTITLIFP